MEYLIDLQEGKSIDIPLELTYEGELNATIRLLAATANHRARFRKHIDESYRYIRCLFRSFAHVLPGKQLVWEREVAPTILTEYENYLCHTLMANAQNKTANQIYRSFELVTTLDTIHSYGVVRCLALLFTFGYPGPYKKGAEYIPKSISEFVTKFEFFCKLCEFLPGKKMKHQESQVTLFLGNNFRSANVSIDYEHPFFSNIIPLSSKEISDLKGKSLRNHNKQQKHLQSEFEFFEVLKHTNSLDYANYAWETLVACGKKITLEKGEQCFLETAKKLLAEDIIEVSNNDRACPSPQFTPTAIGNASIGFFSNNESATHVFKHFDKIRKYHNKSPGHELPVDKSNIEKWIEGIVEDYVKMISEIISQGKILPKGITHSNNGITEKDPEAYAIPNQFDGGKTITFEKKSTSGKIAETYQVIISVYSGGFSFILTCF